VDRDACPFAPVSNFCCDVSILTGTVGVPIKLLFEAEGMKITVEVSNVDSALRLF
jgi:hypothetical protein